MTVTEMACVILKPGLDTMNPTTPEGQVLLRAWKPVMAAPEGPHHLYYGMEIEDPSKLWAVCEWDSIEDHLKFAKSFGAEAVKELPTILSGKEFSKHFAVKPFPALVLQSPVTEVLLCYFPSDISAAGKATAAAWLQQFVEKGLGQCSDVKAVNSGWGVEKDFPMRGVEAGQLASVLAVFIGWPSADASSKFRETKAFKDNMELISGTEDIIHLTRAHISYRYLGKEPEQ